MDPMSGVHARAVRKAVEFAGGAQQLAGRLGVAVADVRGWLAGGAQPPQDVFLRIVDVLLEQPPQQNSGHDAPR
jgi:hypothetical protein